MHKTKTLSSEASTSLTWSHILKTGFLMSLLDYNNCPIQSEQDVRRLEKEEWLLGEQMKYLEEDQKRWAARFEAQKKTKDLKAAEKMEKDQLKKRIQVVSGLNIVPCQEKMLLKRWSIFYPLNVHVDWFLIQ